MRDISKVCVAELLAAFLFVTGCSHGTIEPSALPGATGPVASPYVIGAEDVLEIRVWGEQALSGKVTVRADGMISLPLIRDIQAAGCTPPQLEDNLTEKFKEFVDRPNVSVMALEVNSFKIFVSGYVKTPGVYRLRSETTLLQLIPMVGGFSDWANPKKILVIRKENGEERRIISNYKGMADGKIPALVLKPGDNIIVP